MDDNRISPVCAIYRLCCRALDVPLNSIVKCIKIRFVGAPGHSEVAGVLEFRLQLTGSSGNALWGSTSWPGLRLVRVVDECTVPTNCVAVEVVNIHIVQMADEPAMLHSFYASRAPAPQQHLIANAKVAGVHPPPWRGGIGGHILKGLDAGSRF